MNSTPTVCIGTSNTLRYPQGGHLWVFVNWADGFRANGCRIVWLDVIDPTDTPEKLHERISILRSRIAPFGLDQTIALVMPDGSAVPAEYQTGCLGPDEATSADLLFDLRYDFPESLVSRFAHSALLDIDPGMLQLAMKAGHMKPARHDVNFTIGETVGQPGSRFPSMGLVWEHIPPCVSTSYWKPSPPPPGSAYTTVSHWYMDEWIVEDDGSYYKNDKRSGYLPYVELPKRVKAPMELAIHLAGEVAEREMLEGHGWSIREAHEVAAEPTSFQKYLQESRGEFGCAKPAYVKLQTSWLSDRTLCYLASGRPAVIQNTGPSRYLTEQSGVLRFNTLEEAAAAIEEAESNYPKHATAARALVEEHFAADKVARRVLERCWRG